MDFAFVFLECYAILKKEVFWIHFRIITLSLATLSHCMLQDKKKTINEVLQLTSHFSLLTVEMLLQNDSLQTFK